jgi:hypothetical protein
MSTDILTKQIIKGIINYYHGCAFDEIKLNYLIARDDDCISEIIERICSKIQVQIDSTDGLDLENITEYFLELVDKFYDIAVSHDADFEMNLYLDNCEYITREIKWHKY